MGQFPHPDWCMRYYMSCRLLQAAACETRTHTRMRRRHLWDVQDALGYIICSAWHAQDSVYLCTDRQAYASRRTYVHMVPSRDYDGTLSFFPETQLVPVYLSTPVHSMWQCWQGLVWGHPGFQACAQCRVASLYLLGHTLHACMHARHQFIQVSAHSCDVSCSHA
jgi:hypothetical protein